MVIDFSNETERRLRDEAARVGQPPEEIARRLVESGLTGPDLEIDLAQFRKAVLASGETPEETVQFFQSVVDEVRADRSRSNC